MILDLPDPPRKAAIPALSLGKPNDGRTQALQETRKRLSPKQFLSHLDTLREGGVTVPDLMYEMAQQQVWEIEGVRVVYHCFYCGRREVLYVPAKEVTCGLGCGRPMKVVWKSKAQDEIPWNLEA